MLPRLRLRCGRTAGGACVRRALLYLAVVVFHASGAPAPPSEYEVKAAFLLNFTKFVEWPDSSFPSAGAPFTVCIVGADPFGPVIDEIMRGEKVNNHRIAVQRNRAPETQGCQIAFMSGSNPDVSTIVNGTGPGVLTVGEGDEFVRENGIIGFVMDHHRVRFDINLNAAGRGSLSLSSRLLSVARTVVH
jgi:hypothetical protein